MRNMVVELNQDVGHHLLTFLAGTDATNFIEAVNSSKQFWSIAKTTDYHFIEITKSFYGHPRISLSPYEVLGDFTNEYNIDDEQLVGTSRYYSNVIEPSVRLYIHPCFSVEGFEKLCQAHKSSLFQCYCRLIPLNTVSYSADFGLIDYKWYGHTMGSERPLNRHEKQLFKGNNCRR